MQHFLNKFDVSEMSVYSHLYCVKLPPEGQIMFISIELS